MARTLRQIAASEIKRALRAATRPEDEAEAVHTVRQQLKRLRALVRLPNGRFKRYRAENRAFRDLGRRLAATREAEVLAQSYDDVIARARIDPPATLRQRLVDSKQHHVSPGELAGTLSHDIAAGLRSARRRAAGWRFEDKGFDLVGRGLGRVYRQMRLSGLEAKLHTDARHLHEWRKQVKYHAAQLKLLSPVGGEALGIDLKVLDQLAELLGEHHDLDMLRAALEGLPAEAAAGRDTVIAAIADRAAELEAAAFRLGDQLNGDTPAAFRRRIADAWRNWRH